MREPVLRSCRDAGGDGGEPCPAPAMPRFSRARHYSEEAVQARLDWLRRVSGADPVALAAHHLDPPSLAGNIENFVGAVQLPVGIAGPLWVRGVHVRDAVPVPVATTEGALVSSVSRGAAVCNAAGGVQVHVVRRTMVRAPVFYCRGLEGAVALEAWLGEHFDEVRAEAERGSSVARLQQIRSHVFDDSVHVQFYFSTGDAAGQNMTTACTWLACRWIAEAVAGDPVIGLRDHVIEGNLSGDKKASQQNYALGRGTAVTARCRIPDRLLRRALRISAREFVRTWQSGEVGALQAGMQGSNINFANLVAGVFAATGQDLACVHESSAGYLKAREEGGDLVLAAYLPALVMGSVGGGTQLPAQADCLALMGCAGPGGARRLAEIVAAACLALDLSTGAAITASEFVQAHERLGRNRPGPRLRREHIDAELLSRMLRVPGERVRRLGLEHLDAAGSILTRVAADPEQGAWGLYRCALELDGPGGRRRESAVLKLKPPGSRLFQVASQVARLSGDDRLGGLFEAQGSIFGLERCASREVEFYRRLAPGLAPHVPRCLGTLADPSRQLHGLLLEDLSDGGWLPPGADPGSWPAELLDRALEVLADIHARHWLGAGETPPGPGFRGPEAEDYARSGPLLATLTAFNAERFPELLDARLRGLLEAALEDPGTHRRRCRQFGTTLTHNDCSPRNIAWRDGRALFYDWELACLQSPHHDVAELLAFALEDGAGAGSLARHARHYRRHLSRQLGVELDADEFLEGLRCNTLDLLLVRFNLYLLGHGVLRFPFMERVYRNLARLLLAPELDPGHGG